MIWWRSALGSGKAEMPDRDRERPAPAVVATQRRGEQVIGDDLGTLGVAAGEQQGELVAAGPVGAIAATQVGAHDLRDRPQEVVAGGVTLLVVDGLEVVDVDHDERDRSPVLACLGDARVELLLERPVVAQAGQPVEERIEPGPVVCLTKLRELAIDRGEPFLDPPLLFAKGPTDPSRDDQTENDHDRRREGRQEPRRERDRDGLEDHRRDDDREGEHETEAGRARDRVDRPLVEMAFATVVLRQAGSPSAVVRPRDPPVPDRAARNSHTKVMGPSTRGLMAPLEPPGTVAKRDRRLLVEPVDRVDLALRPRRARRAARGRSRRIRPTCAALECRSLPPPPPVRPSQCSSPSSLFSATRYASIEAAMMFGPRASPVVLALAALAGGERRRDPHVDDADRVGALPQGVDVVGQ